MTTVSQRELKKPINIVSQRDEPAYHVPRIDIISMIIVQKRRAPVYHVVRILGM